MVRLFDLMQVYMDRCMNACQVSWLMPIILATLEAETRRAVVQGQPGGKVLFCLVGFEF
jgi:hypothetical protein